LGARPHVKVYDGRIGTILGALVPSDPRGTLAEFALTGSFFAYDTAFQGGVFVNAGDFDLDGHAEILVGAGRGAAPHVKIFRGDIPGFEIASFIAFQQVPTLPNSGFGSPVNDFGVSSVAFGGFDQNTGTLDVLVSTGRGEPARVFSAPLVALGRLIPSIPLTTYYVPTLPPLLTPIVFPPELILVLGVLQDGAQIGGVVTAPNKQ